MSIPHYPAPEGTTDILFGHDAVAMKYNTLAISTVILWDHFCTIDDEIKYMWKGKKNSWVFFLFMANRYLCFGYAFTLNPIFLATGFTQAMCTRTAWAGFLSLSIFTTLAQCLLALRVYALSLQKKYIAYGFSVLIVLQMAWALYIMVDASHKSIVMPYPTIPAFHICLPIIPQSTEVAYMAISLVYDGIAFALTVWYSVSSVGSWKTKRLVRTMLRDGTLYFAVIFTSNAVLLYCMSNFRPILRYVHAESGTMLQPVMAIRLMLSLRKAAAKGRSGDETTEQEEERERDRQMYSESNHPDTVTPQFKVTQYGEETDFELTRFAP